MPYDFAIDTWSIGCTLFELYTGKILFTGATNNQMLRSIMECRGKFSLKMLKKAEFARQHFDDSLMFRSEEKDKITGKVCASFTSLSLKPKLIGGIYTECRSHDQLSQANQRPQVAPAQRCQRLERCGNEGIEPFCGPTRSMPTSQPGETMHTYGCAQPSFHQSEETVTHILRMSFIYTAITPVLPWLWRIISQTHPQSGLGGLRILLAIRSC